MANTNWGENFYISPGGCLDTHGGWIRQLGAYCSLQEYSNHQYLIKATDGGATIRYVHTSLAGIIGDPDSFNANVRMKSPTASRGRWGVFIQDNGNTGGISLVRTSDSNTDLYLMVSDSDGVATWLIRGSVDGLGIDSAGWHKYSFTTERYYGSAPSGSYGRYTKLQIDDNNVFAVPPPDTYRVSDYGGHTITYPYILAYDQLAPYAWGMDDLNLEGIFDVQKKYNKFPRWQKTQYGMRPCY